MWKSQGRHDNESDGARRVSTQDRLREELSLGSIGFEVTSRTTRTDKKVKNRVTFSQMEHITFMKAPSSLLEDFAGYLHLGRQMC